MKINDAILWLDRHHAFGGPLKGSGFKITMVGAWGHREWIMGRPRFTSFARQEAFLFASQRAAFSFINTFTDLYEFRRHAPRVIEANGKIDREEWPTDPRTARAIRRHVSAIMEMAA